MTSDTIFSYHYTYYTNRIDAGKQLAKRLIFYKKDCPIILALPRGGVIVANEVAKKLALPFEVFIARKIRALDNPECNIGAIAEGDTLVLDSPSIALLGYSEADITGLEKQEDKEVKRRIHAYRGNRALPNLFNKTVILIDDGLATGVTALAAVHSVRKKRPKRIILAVPVCSFEPTAAIKQIVDDVICLVCSDRFHTIGSFYEDFPHVSDEEAQNILAGNTSK